MSTNPSPAVSRRRFVAATAAGAALTASGWSCSRVARPSSFTGSLLGSDASLGHRLRNRDFPAPKRFATCNVAILGAGISGLAAARRLHRAGIGDLQILELENLAGGNSRSGANSISAYPWGAHYVPICNSECRDVLQLFEDLGVITGYSQGAPIYRDEFLCAEPMERLFMHGRWQEGLVPQLGLRAEQSAQVAAFLAAMDVWRKRRGADGRKAFAIPLDLSSTDPEILRLDALTMATFLDQQGYNAPALRWYVDYCMRDDYGATSSQVSAWAGIHYFAARDAIAANAPPHAVLTWPEGNGWLVQQLKRGLEQPLQTRSLVWAVRPSADGVEIDYYSAAEQQSIRIQAKFAICALPRFVARHLVEGATSLPEQYPPIPHYPWMVANLTLASLPLGAGVPLSWDNVNFHGSSLGYVVATHQSLHPFPKGIVLTYYQPLTQGTPSEARQSALSKSYDEWCQDILGELSTMHPGLERSLRHLDVWVWGHGMPSPAPGFLWGPSRQSMAKPQGRLLFAHSDMSGIGIFEEAYTRGVQAADLILNQLTPQS